MSTQLDFWTKEVRPLREAETVEGLSEEYLTLFQRMWDATHGGPSVAAHVRHQIWVSTMTFGSHTNANQVDRVY